MFGTARQRQQANFKLRRKGLPRRLHLKAKHKGPDAWQDLKKIIREDIANRNFEERVGLHTVHPFSTNTGHKPTVFTKIIGVLLFRVTHRDKQYVKSKMNLPFFPNKIRSISIGISGFGALGPLYGNLGPMLVLDTDGLKVGVSIDIGLGGLCKTMRFVILSLSKNLQDTAKAFKGRSFSYVPPKGQAG